jgi:type IV secretion system protein VirD4
VLPAALIAQLRKGEVVIIRRGMPPALGTVPMVWKRRDVRAARRRQRRAQLWRRVKVQSADAAGKARQITTAGR